VRGSRKRSRSVEDRLKDIQHEILVAVASGEPLSDVMTLLCRRAEEVAPDALCSIIRVDFEGRLRPLAAPSLPPWYSRGIDGLPIGPMTGSCGTAAYSGEPVEVVDIGTDPRWARFKAAARILGLSACWSTPIKSHDGRVIGTFAFYFRRPRPASRLEKRIVDRCAHLCAIAIEHWDARARIGRLAYTDAMTGLGNHAFLAEEFPKIVDRAKALGKEVAVFYVDLNGFRAVNAAQGHKIGDQLLRAVAARIRGACATADLIARLGADEFLIAKTETHGGSEFEAMASALSVALAERYDIDHGMELKIGASVGVARFPHDGADLEALMGQADTALRQVKGSGRPGYAFYTAKLDAERRARQAFERDVSVAAFAGQLSLVFQPQAEARTGVIKGFEALLRWNHPIHGYVPPNQFIPAAEACGAIEGIGAFVLRKALALAAGWPRHLRVAVNVSPAQIVHADFAELVESVLGETGVDASRLEIEVTESLFIYDADTALETLNRLKALGVSVAMDDFGTGYSSLSTLRSFPFDRIKIDRSFIGDMVSNKDAAAIVNSIMTLGKAIGRRVIAEGVETAEQLELLKKQGCNEVQGFLIGKPLPIERYAVIMEKSKPRRTRVVGKSKPARSALA